MKMTDRFLALTKVATLVAISVFLPAGCGDEEQASGDIVDNSGSAGTGTGQEVMVTPQPRQVVFSSGGMETRTSLDTAKNFNWYWEPDDKILVDINGTWTPNDSSTITGRTRQADFYFDGVTLDAPSYDVLYTGNGASPSSTHVTIARTQTQQDWNDASHLGISGDCGTAQATQNGDVYEFTLEHQAAYLIIYPYTPDFSNALDLTSYKLTEIKIVSKGEIAGTYPFSMDGLDMAKATQQSDTVTLTCGTDGFALEKTASKHVFVVIQPGSHTLTLKYTFKTPENHIVTYNKDLSKREYKPNGVTVIKHQFIVFDAKYYQWGATDTFLNTYFDGYNKTTMPPTQLSMTTPVNWAGLPNANELDWYVANGDPRWDDSTIWYMKGDPNPHTGGMWFMKKSAIIAAGKTFRADISSQGVDLRSVSSSGHSEVGSQTPNFYADNKPTNTANYFFLPMLGSYVCYDTNNIFHYYFANNVVYFMSKSPYKEASGGREHQAYGISINKNSSYVYACVSSIWRRHGAVVAPEWFQ